MATDYAARLAEQRAPAAVAARVARGKAILKDLGYWIDRYRGGVPAGFAAAAIQWESNGNAGAMGDAGLGEVGYFQVPKTFPPTIGMSEGSRMVPEANVFLGLMEYQLEAVKQAQAQPLVELGTADSWKLARLAFAIGSGGTRTLVQEAAPTRRGKVFDAVRDYVNRTGGRAFGSQSAGLVWYRVHTVDLVWDIGQQIRSGGVGMPTRVPAPPGMTYVIPPALAPGFESRALGAFPLTVVVAGLAFYLIMRS